ncbi:uncharacterized protein LOC132190823 [Corylus avellana]|uniref:uncharacterized protein LOC132190823 n=1 Tax=Corylus avellana TaxID=13451 RepID=UPI00286A29C5|nr:uncharacterized protein LOC132190823 [Corylus avellana]
MLLKAQFIEEVHYPDWLANGKWRMCVDFIDLNKACPKGSFPLPRIDALVDSTSGYGHAFRSEEFRGDIPEIGKQDVPRTDRMTHGSCPSFFKILRKAFEWFEECQKAFRELKKYLVNPPLLSRTVPGEVLYLYLTVSPIAVSAALVLEEEGVQKLMYFISRALKGVDETYPQMEKLAFALTTASKKLLPYFQAHTIRVLTEYLLRKVLCKLDLSGRLANWAIELRGFDIEFLPRNSIKGQALVDFLAEFTNLSDAKQWPRDETLVVQVDGSSTRRHGGARVILITPEGEELHNSIRLEFRTTNNEVEYEAVIAGLSLAQELGAECIELRSDSQVIVGHIQGKFKAKVDKMRLYLSKVQDLQSSFKKFYIIKIPMDENEGADHLARIASTEESIGEFEEIIQTLSQPTIAEAVSVSIAKAVPDWQEEVVEYLEKGIFPAGKKSAIQLRKKAARFSMVNGILYKRGFMLPLLKCVFKEEGNYILHEIHEGICGSHSGARMLAHKAVQAGFYWPNMTKDLVEMVRNWNKCQLFANITKQPPDELSSVSSPWPFLQWGVEIVGPLHRGNGGVRFAVVAVDYFTKWVEVEALVNITAKSIEKFLWKNVICRHGIPHAFVTDNGKQFDYDSFKEWCAKPHIRNYFSSLGHPQAKGQVEIINKSIFKLFKKKLGDRKGDWVEDLPEVLWAYRTMRRTPTEETPYALAFGTEAVIPAEVGSGNFRVETFWLENNDEGLLLHLDLLQEKRDQAQVSMSAYQGKVAWYFNKKVKHRSFKVGDLVLRKVTIATKDPTEGKLAPNWEGPYKVTNCRRAGAYYLEDSEGKTLPRPWNAEHLKNCHTWSISPLNLLLGQVSEGSQRGTVEETITHLSTYFSDRFPKVVRGYSRKDYNSPLNLLLGEVFDGS